MRNGLVMCILGFGTSLECRIVEYLVVLFVEGIGKPHAPFSFRVAYL